ncbi:hypothetical protein LTR94_028160, partial [Friedmanniomyces endolithicus]
MKALTIGGRINLLAVVTIAGLLSIAGLSLLRLDAALRQEIADSTQRSVEIAHSVVADFQAQEAAGRLSREEAQAAAKAAVGAMRYGSGDYFWINDTHPKMVMHPIKPELNGTDISQNKDANGVLMFQKMVDVVAAEGAGFVAYDWAKPGEQAASPKISYVKGFAPWGWVIGSGVYTDQIAATVGRAALALGVMALVIAILVGCSGWLIGRSVSQPVVMLGRRMRALADGDQQSDIPGLERRDEIGQM